LEIPKQYAEIKGKTVIRRAIEPFLFFSDIDEIIVSARREDFEIAERGLCGIEKLRFVQGGATRMESVANALFSIPCDHERTVIVHDAARPYPSPGLVARIFSSLDDEIDGVIPVVPVHDALKVLSAESAAVLNTVRREGLAAAQTPQIFWLERLKGFYSQVLDRYVEADLADIQDDSQVVEMCGGTVYYVAGESANIKITLESDFLMIEKMID
ncbi:MAG: 2-C-methyl-D-erythritol 4-phosphate cytidylyltransferase, partial [Deltaproteobacteria bacterium]|nr:2-C-methyl-D-erythritol 4-phosphate cytidylyltransferase [Deltaproteobacteria bacterium]